MYILVCCGNHNTCVSHTQIEKQSSNEIIKKPTNHEKKAALKAYDYRNSSYKKFYSAAEQPHRQAQGKKGRRK